MFIVCRGKSAKGLESSGEVVGGDEVGEMRNELILGFVVISLDDVVLDRPVHPPDLSIDPRVIRLGPATFVSRWP
jgi:hypothetical protein